MISTLGVIGLGTMGANLARNAARQGVKVALFNRTTEKVNDFMTQYGAEGLFVPCKTLEELRNALRPPRVIVLMVKAGEAVDAVIEELVSHLEAGDIIVDGGNSHYRDTERRLTSLDEDGFRFLGLGISGGEEGALHGPSMMAGGDGEAYRLLEPLLSAMAAEDGRGGKCVMYMGPGGAGHFVKMVHNGIEYAIMQLIAESYDVLRTIGGFDAGKIADLFSSWNQGDLQSFLTEITAQVLRRKDPTTGKYLVDVIKDVAGQKGTGKWTTEASMEYGVATPTINAAVEARILSALPEMRIRRSKEFPEALLSVDISPEQLAFAVHASLEVSTLIAYLQGFELLARASYKERWCLPLAHIARIWRGGCIIRSSLLEVFERAYGGTPEEMKQEKQGIIDRFRDEQQLPWRHIAALALYRGIPVPALAASLAYFDSIRSAHLPQNLVQAQRDFFGAHTFERIDQEGVFHDNWK